MPGGLRLGAKGCLFPALFEIRALSVIQPPSNLVQRRLVDRCHLIHHRFEPRAHASNCAIALAHFGSAQHGLKIAPVIPARIGADPCLRIVDMDRPADETRLMADNLVIGIAQRLENIGAGARRHLEGADNGLAAEFG